MVFLILTRHGFEDLKVSLGRVPSPLFINKGVLTGEEVDQLRSSGADVAALVTRVDPHSSSEVEHAVQTIQKSLDQRVWVERVTPDDEAIDEDLPLRPSDNNARDLKQSLHKFGSTTGALSGRAWAHLKRLASAEAPLMILPYMGYGTAERLVLSGRVLKDERFAAPSDIETGWKNLVELYKRLESDEVPGARVRVRFAGVEQETVTDREGYFSVEIHPARPLEQSGWHTVDLELIDPPPPPGKTIYAAGQVLVPPATARFGIISDIDDTVLWTNAANKLKMLLMLALSNAHTRKPFKGVTAFYRALRDGAGGDEGNPVFYVSSSPWNLYTPLVDFLTVQEIPLGPLLLTDLGLRTLFGSNRHHTHKLASIERILQAFPNLPFILIGDSGQQDPEIYRQIVQRHPQRVRVIYIRNVNPDPSRIEAIDRLVEEVRHTGTQLVLAPDSEFAAAHAAAEGLIRADGLGSVRRDKEADEQVTEVDN